MIYVIYFILICVALFFIRKFLNKFKVVKIGSLALFSGGVKTGKSTLSVSTVLSEYRAHLRSWKIHRFFAKIFKKPVREKPLIYSNVPLALPYVELDEDLLLRKKRFRYGSVIYCQEASLVADSQLIRDMELNERLLLFNKLIGHETKGGVLIYDTQCISDLHYSIKRCLSNYFHIHHIIKWLPFFLILYVREYSYSADGDVINTTNSDVEDNLKRVIIPKSTWKYFDCYCYSSLTDDLPVKDDLINNNKQTKNLKARKIFSFRKNLVGGSSYEKENN